MRILFAGSPGIAAPALEAAAELSRQGGGFELAGLLTNADSPKGRRGTPEPTELALCAAHLSPPIPVLKPETLDAAARESVAALQPDVLVSFAYGKIFGPKFLALFPLGGINIHPSLLPKYRGPTPVQAAILNRDAVTGITIQRLALEMDAGDILLSEAVPLCGRETAADLSGVMAQKAAVLLPAALRGLAAGTLRAQPQNHGEATYCSLLEKDAGLIDWTLSAAAIDAQIRAYNPWPLSQTTHGGETLFILEAEPVQGDCNSIAPAGAGNPPLPGMVLGTDRQKGILVQTGDGVLAVRALQYRARKALEWKAFLNGARNFIGTILGN